MIYYEDEGAPADDLESVKWSLGLNYALAGESVGKNYVEAAKWFRKAAEQGLAPAQYMLGAMYAVGDGVPKNDIESMKWTRKAAEQRESKSQFHLGLIYAEGAGVRKDNIEAVMRARKRQSKGMPMRSSTLAGCITKVMGYKRTTSNRMRGFSWVKIEEQRGQARSSRFWKRS